MQGSPRRGYDLGDHFSYISIASGEERNVERREEGQIKRTLHETLAGVAKKFDSERRLLTLPTSTSPQRR